MKKRLISVLLALSLVVCLAACGSSTEESTVSQANQDPNATDVNVGLIMGPPSMGLGWFMEQAENGETYNNYNFTVAGTDYTEVSADLNAGNYDIITCPSNLCAILFNNEDMKEDIKVISISNLGLLYIVTTDKSVKTLDDLKGRTVYSIGEGGTPEYTFEYILQQSGLEDDVNLSFRSTPFEVLNLLQDEENAIACFPQPFVEVAKLLVEDLQVPVDLTESWNDCAEDGAEAISTVTVVRTEFLETHEQAVKEYLEYSKKSTDYTNSHLDEAAGYTEKYETFMNPEIAADAIPQCNIVTITGKDMKEQLSGFLQVMYDMNPEIVGGKMPTDDMYYIPSED